LRKVNLPLKFEHPFFEDADARDERALIAFKLDDALAVRFREAVKSLQNLGLAIADDFDEFVPKGGRRVNHVSLGGRFVAVFHCASPFRL
jgi:hypothetical protein